MQAPFDQNTSAASNPTSARTGVPCPGNVQFRCNFESGNIGEVRQLSECEYDIKIRPDTNNNRHRLWFYFSASNIVNNQQVLLNIVNFSKTKSLYREGLAPVVCSRRRPQWTRIPSSQVFYYRSPKGPGNRMAYVMSFLFQFDGANDGPYFFAYSFPYTYTDLQRYLYSLERQHLPFLQREALCRTLQQRRIDLLTITAPEGEAGARPLRERKWVFLSARVHPGETPAQFIIHGVIDFLAGESSRARALRANVVFKITPMLNPDGVANGNYRCSYLGFDLNRHWLAPSAWAQPEILSVKNLVTTLHQDPSVDLDLYIDIHAHSVGTNSFMYGNNIPTRRKGWTTDAAAGPGSLSPPPSSPRGSSSPRPGSEMDSTARSRDSTAHSRDSTAHSRGSTSSCRPQPVPQVPEETGYQAPKSGTSSSSPEPTSTSAVPSSPGSPPPKPPPVSAMPTATATARSTATVQSRISHSAPAGNKAAAAASGEFAGRSPTPLAEEKSVAVGGGASRGGDGGGADGNGDNKSLGGGGGADGSGGNARNTVGSSSAAVGNGNSGVGAKAGEKVEPDEGFDPRGDLVSVFPRMLAQNAPDFSFARSKFDADPSKEGTGRRALGQLLSPDVLCFTLEASFYGYASLRDGSVGLVPYTRGGYIELGRSLASTFFDYYGLAY